MSINVLYTVQQSTTGQGLFAQKAIVKCTRVIEYVGKKIPMHVADALKTAYLFDLENGWTIDGEASENTARYVNHSCIPNCEARIENERIYFYALRDITRGEEITIDYGKEYFDEFIKPHGCKCTLCYDKCAVQK